MAQHSNQENWIRTNDISYILTLIDNYSFFDDVVTKNNPYLIIRLPRRPPIITTTNTARNSFIDFLRWTHTPNNSQIDLGVGVGGGG